MAENTNQTSENQDELSKKDFHEIMMQQYQLLNSQFSTIRQLQLDKEERSAEFDFTRLIPGFLRKKKNADGKESPSAFKSLFINLFNQSILLVSRYYKVILACGIAGLIYGIVIYFTATKIYTNTIKYNAGVLSNSFFEPIVNKLGQMTDDDKALAKSLGITQDEASKIVNIYFSEFRSYKLEKKVIINDTLTERVSYYPFFDIVISTTDNSILDNVEVGLTNYLSNNSYIKNRTDLLAYNYTQQLSDLNEQVKNLDTLSNTAVAFLRQTENNKYYVKETGLGGNGGIILSQDEKINDIIGNVLRESRYINNQRMVIYEQLALIEKDDFQLIDSHSSSTSSSFPKGKHIIMYTIYGIFFGICLAIILTIFKLLQKKAALLEKAESENQATTAV